MATLTAQPIRVLIVDDEPKVALTVAANLEWLGADIVVDTAHSFADAFSRVQRNQYALLIVDFDIPGLSGLDLARAARRVSPDTQVVLMTAHGNQALRDTARLLGLAGFLDKPFSMDQLRQLVQCTVDVSTTSCRVLLMEGKDSLRRLFGGALRSAGYRVYEAATLQDARALLAVCPFDIFICTLDMHGERVLNWVRAQRARFSQAGTHVIAISAEGGHRHNWEDMGVDFYLETPVATTPLVTLVHRLTVERHPV